MENHNKKNLGLARSLRQRMTSGERLLWLNLKNSNYGPKFRRQVPIGNFILDLYCPAARLCVEIDGPHHLEQGEKDRAQDEALADKLILTIRFSSERVWYELDEVVKEIVQIANERIEANKRRAKPNLPPPPSPYA